MAYHTYEGDFDDPMLQVRHGGWVVFGMTLAPVAPESRDWLCRHIDQAFAEAIEAAEKRAVEAYKIELRELLGVH